MSPGWKISSCATTRAMVRPSRRPAMWFTSIFLKTLRDFRIAILGWGVGMGLATFEVQATVGSLVSTPAARATLVSLASSFAWNADPVAVDTVGGYATWKVGIFFLLVAIWPLMACSRLLRGEEERGSLDVLLSLPRGRARVALAKLAAGWTALLFLGLLGLSVLLSGAALWLFVRRDVGATVALPSFLRLPERTVRPEQALPVNAWSLRSVYARSLAKMAVPTFWWTLGIAGFAAWMVVVVKQIEGQLKTLSASSSFLRDLITKVGGGDVNFNANLLSALFVLLPLLLMAFAVTQANRWAADEEEGRQELVLATPQPRLAVLLARFGALTTATVIIGVLTLAATALASAASGLALDGGNLAAATLSIIPLGLLMAALGYLFSGWLRTAVDTGLLSFLLVIWFFITFIGPGLNWPDTTLRLSAFYYYGTPLLHGLPLLDTLGVLAVGVVALALASVRFVRKDIGR